MEFVVTPDSAPPPCKATFHPAISAIAFAALCCASHMTAFAADTPLRTEVVAQGLEHPWGMAFIDGNRILVTERPGRLRLVQPSGEVGAPIAGLPEIDAGGQGGLLDILADRDFKTNRRLYFCYAEPGSGGNSTALASACRVRPATLTVASARWSGLSRRSWARTSKGWSIRRSVRRWTAPI